VLDSIYGDGMGSFMGAFYVIAFHIFLWTWGIAILARGRDDIKLTPKKALLNYGTVPCAIGILLYLLKPLFVMPESVGKFFSYLGGLCTPISVLITGGLLATISLGSMFKNRKLYLMSFLKLLVFPIVACVLAKLCGLSDTYVILCTVMAGLPCASTVVMLAELHDIEPAYASQTVGMTSLLTTATLPCVVLFAKWIITL
jgi:predicted permease